MLPVQGSLMSASPRHQLAFGASLTNSLLFKQMFALFPIAIPEGTWLLAYKMKTVLQLAHDDVRSSQPDAPRRRDQ